MDNFTDYLAQYPASLHLSLSLLVGWWLQLARIHPYSKGQTAFYTDALGGAVLFSVFLVPIIFQIVDPKLVSWFASEQEEGTWKRKYFGRYHKWATSFERKHHYTPHKAVVDKHAVVVVDKAAAVVSLDVILEGEGECGGSSRLEPHTHKHEGENETPKSPEEQHTGSSRHCSSLQTLGERAVSRTRRNSFKTLDLAAAGDVSVSEPAAGLEAEQAWEGNEEEWHGEDGEDGEDGEEGVWDEEEGAWDEEGGEWDEEDYTEAADSEKNKANYGIVASPPTSMIRVMV
jgi:hypothetical protein